MKNRTRHIFFYLAIAIFVVFAPTLALYSLGYRFDWRAKAIRKVGMIIIEVQPKEAKVYLNNKFVAKQSPIKIKNLLPGDYTVRVEQDGFFVWEKKLSVKSQEVNWANHVFLVKKEWPEEILTKKSSKYFSISPDNKTLAYLSESKKNKGIWIKKMKGTFSSAKNDEEEKIFPNSADTFTKNNDLNSINFTSINFPGDSKNILFSWNTNFGTTQYGILNIEKKNTLYLSDSFGINIKNVKFHNNDIYFLDQNRLMRTDFSAKKAEIIKSDVIDYAFYKDSLFYLKNEKNGAALIDDANNSKMIGQILKTDEAELKISSLGYLTYSDRKNNKLYVNISGAQKEISNNNLLNFIWSKSGDKLIFHTSSEVWMYYVNTDTKVMHPEYLSNQTELITRISKNINAVDFFDSEHGYYLSNGRMNLFEFDDRDKRNINEINLKILENSMPIISNNFIYFIRGTDKKIVSSKID